MKKANIRVYKKGNKYIVADGYTNKDLYNVGSVPVYDMFNFGRAVRSGIGSVMNAPGNYYSFRRYLSMTDEKAIESDWRNVGISFLDALSLIK